MKRLLLVSTFFLFGLSAMMAQSSYTKVEAEEVIKAEIAKNQDAAKSDYELAAYVHVLGYLHEYTDSEGVNVGAIDGAISDFRLNEFGLEPELKSGLKTSLKELLQLN